MQELEPADTVLARIKKNFQVDFEKIEIDGRTLEILEITNMEEHLNKLIIAKKIQQPLRDLPLWAKTWPGSMVLGRFLRNYSPKGKNLLEIGAGMGLLSLIASAYGFEHILSTDINKHAVDFIKMNVLRNNLQHIIKPGVLDITQNHLGPDYKFDMIAGSELLYLDELHRPLLKILLRHLNPDGKAFFCTDRKRLKPNFAKLAEKNFSLVEGNIGIKSNDNERNIYNIIILSPK